MSIFIRPLEFSDAEALYSLRNINREFFKPFEPLREDSDFTLQSMVANIADAMEKSENDLSYSFGIFSIGSKELLGRINLSNVSRGAFQSCTLGYFLDEKHNGKGYMSSAIGLVVRKAFDELSLHRVQAAVMPRNVGSIRALEKNGFIFEGLSKYYLQINGVWEDHHIYSLTTENFKK